MSLGLFGVIESLLTPPGIVILLLLLAWLLAGRRQAMSRALLLASFLLLYISTIPFTSLLLASVVETTSSISLDDFESPRAQAIVILGSGRREHAPEFNLPDKHGDTLSANELERIRYGVWLARKARLPILVSGGLADEDGRAEAVMMKRMIEEEVGARVKWYEPDSRNTFENAQYSAEMLQQDGVKTVYLVTHAFHMPRAQWAFEQAGLAVVPAPTAYISDEKWQWRWKHFLPDPRAVQNLGYLLHEIMGYCWYRLRYA